MNQPLHPESVSVLRIALLIGIVLLVTLGSANGGQSRKPLTVTATVVSSCVVSVARTAISNLVHGHCSNGASFRVGIDHRSGTDTTVSGGPAGGNGWDTGHHTGSNRAVIVNGQNKSGKLHAHGGLSNTIRITIDF